jgi:cell cycle sensor histidine kinase DivJ
VLLIGIATLEAAVASHRRTLCVGIGLAGMATVAVAGANAEHSISAWAAGLALAASAFTATTVLIQHLIHAVARETRLRRDVMAARGRIEAALDEVLVGVDRAGLVRSAGGNPAKVLGLPADALLGRGLIDLTLVADRPALLKACGDSFADKAPATARVRLRTSPDGDAPAYRWVELSLSGEAGDAIMTAAIRDAAAAAAGDASLEDAATGMEQSDAARSAFFASLSHELRTPLNAVVGFSEFLANPETSPSDAARVREYAGLIHDAGQQLTRKVSTMIDIARLRSGAYAAALERTDLAQLVSQAVESFQRDAGDRVTVSCVDGDDAIEADVDARALRGALDEVLSNAVRHGAGAPVTVVVTAEGLDAGIAVMDSGPGLSRIRLTEISRALAGSDDATGDGNGLGRGLTLARELMALHHGSVSISNRARNGATVTLRLPLRAAAAVPSNIVRIGSADAHHPATPHEGARKRA